MTDQDISRFCKIHHIERFAFFGSVLRDDFNNSSDIDVLVEFESGHTPGFFDLESMESDLSSQMGGKKVDIRTSQDLSRYFRDGILHTMDIRYETR